MTVLRYTVPPENEGCKLGLFLRMQGVTAGLIKSVKYDGDGFYSNDQPIRTNEPVHAGQCIRFALPPEQETSVTPQPVPFSIAYEDDFAAVLNKPAGIAVHPTLNYPDGTLANGWLYHLQQQGESGIFRPVNRIDKNTSGLVLCAKNAFAAPLLAGSAHKCYLAIVQGTMPLGPGRVEAPIARRGDSIIGRCVCADGKYSLTEYAVLAAGPGHSLLACWPRTGRTHQIRVHMSYIGHPLTGDTLYGGSDILLRRHALHCGILAFAHPLTGEPLRVECPLPEDMAALARQEKLLTGWQLHSLPCGADPT